MSVIGASAIYGAEAAAPAAPPKAAPAPVMHDMAVGTDDVDLEEIVTEQKLERILSKTDIPHHKPKRVKPKKEQEELLVDRI